MEEKKSIKISLKTYLISMFLMLLVIGILLGYILQTGEKINNEITAKNDNKNIDESIVLEENKINTEKILYNESSVNEIVLEENKINTGKNLYNESSVNEIVVEETKKEEFTDDEIKTALENYLNIFHGYGAQEQLLNLLDLMSYEEAQNYILDDDNYKMTDIKYEEFENRIKEYTTIENFEKLNENAKFVNPHFKNVNGYVAYFDGGWSGVEYVVNNVTIKGDYSKRRYVANYYTIEGEVESSRTTLEFDIENNSGKCIISNCYFE